MSVPVSDVIRFPKNYTAYFFGTATSGVTQEVQVKVQNTDGDDENECTLRALNKPLVVTGGGMGFMNQEAVVANADSSDDRQLEIIFKAFKGNTPHVIKGFKRDVHSPVSWVTNYTYRTEDNPNGDNDYHDTTFVVSLIKINK